MYSSVKNPGLNWKSIILKLIFLVLFVLLIIWLMPKAPNMDPFYSNVFVENINRMKDSAKDYYTTERMPKNIGDSTKMTLKEMEEKYLIIPFLDKDGKSCDKEGSYVEVTKNETDYMLTVNLVCPTEQNKLEVSLGCHNYCEGNSCNKEIEPVEEYIDIVEYEYKKGTDKVSTLYSCPKGYNLSGSTCKKSSVQDKKEAKKNYTIGKTVTVNAKENKGNSYKQYIDKITDMYYTYSCPAGYIKSGSGSDTICTKTTVYKKTPYCTDGTLTGSGNSLVCKQTLTESTTSYLRCNEGTLTGTGSDTTCKTPTTTSTLSYLYCENGILNDTGSNTKCKLTSTTSTTDNLKCEVGELTGSGSNITCKSTTNESTIIYLDCAKGTLTGTGSSTTCKIINKTSTTDYVDCAKGTLTGTGSNTKCLVDNVVSTTDYVDCTKGTLTGSGSSTTCKIDNPIIKNSACPDGYTKSTTDKTKCTKGTKTNVVAQCPDGYTLNGTQCVGSKTETTSKDCTKGTKVTYNSSLTCKIPGSFTSSTSHYTVYERCNCSNGRCSQCPVSHSTTYYYCNGLQVSYSSSSSCYSYNTSYLTCPSGYTPSGSSCIKKVPDYKTPNCNTSGGTLSGGTCIIDTTETVSATCPDSSYTLLSDGTCKKIDYTYETPICTEGTYNSSTGKCDVNGTVKETPICTEGSYNASTGKCDVTSYVYDTPYCTQGTFNASTGKCDITNTNNVKPTCTQGTFNASTGKCDITNTTFIAPKCSQGTYNASTGKCDVNGYKYQTPYCTQGTYNTSTGKCDNKYYQYLDPQCESGYSLNNGVCTKSETITSLADAIANYSYTCPSGYTKSGSGSNTICYKTVQSASTYYCEKANAKLNSNNTCTYKEEDKFSHYSCDAGYTLNANFCYKFGEETISATASTKNSTSYSYKWSTETSLDGWEKTGKTRTKKELKKTEIIIDQK